MGEEVTSTDGVSWHFLREHPLSLEKEDRTGVKVWTKWMDFRGMLTLKLQAAFMCACVHFIREKAHNLQPVFEGD